jgi:hypothetical protein
LPSGKKPDTYWLFTTGALIFLFVMYTVKTGSFSKWVQILLYKPAPATQVGSSGSSGSASPGSASATASPPDAPANVPSYLNKPLFNPWSWVSKQLWF